MASPNPFSLKGKTILVCGASSGIGQGIAVACSTMGATVVITARSKDRLDETLSLMEGEGHQMVVADLTSSGDVSKLASEVTPLDGIVYSVGIRRLTLCRQIVEHDIDTMMSVNFKAPVMLQSEILRKKKIRRGGSIVFIDSIATDSPSYGNALYSASKGALLSYSRCLAIELAPRMIRVNCISPAMVWTSLNITDGVTEDELREDEKNYPLKRYGKPIDIANLAVYLLSDASTWMTGSNVRITGGAK